jgi:hypothetical protein
VLGYLGPIGGLSFDARDPAAKRRCRLEQCRPRYVTGDPLERIPLFGLNVDHDMARGALRQFHRQHPSDVGFDEADGDECPETSTEANENWQRAARPS